MRSGKWIVKKMEEGKKEVKSGNIREEETIRGTSDGKDDLKQWWVAHTLKRCKKK